MNSRPGPILELREVGFGFRNRPAFLGPISLGIEPSQCWAVVGPNGAGKSTLLRLMAGLIRPKSGRIELAGRPLGRATATQRARKLAFLPQRGPEDSDFCVRDVVLMGRYPHRSLGLFESAEDYRIADEAMGRTRVSEFADRRLATLSGGEAQRVHLAAVLAQQPEILLLDEPTTSLDLKHQLAVFEILGELGRAGLAVVVVTHDVNLAGMFCTHALLMNNGQAAASGVPNEVLKPQILETVYEVPLTTATSVPGVSWVVPSGIAGASRE